MPRWPNPPGGQAALVCHTESHHVGITFWDSVAQAAQAERELTPCGADCLNNHVIVHRTPSGRVLFRKGDVLMVVVPAQTSLRRRDR